MKAEAIEELYANLETSEGQRDIYRIAAARDRAGKDIGQMRTIKSATADVLMRDEDIRERWGQHFSWLMNDRREPESGDRGEGTEPRTDRTHQRDRDGEGAQGHEEWQGGEQRRDPSRGMEVSGMVWSRHSLQAVQQHNDHEDHTIRLEGQRTSIHIQGKGRHPRVHELQRDQAPDAHLQDMGASTG